MAACVGSGPGPTELPEISIIVDDIGYDATQGRQTIELQGAFALAVLPFAPHTKDLAQYANDIGKEVILHLPMEAQRNNHLLGPGALRVEMSQNEIKNSFLESFAAVPYAIGVNNHMGSRLTGELEPMRWLMQVIHNHDGLFFVDSRTIQNTLALREARLAEIPSVARDIFIDNVRTHAHVTAQLVRLVEQAKTRGHALGIAHPHKITIAVLRDWRPADNDVALIKLSDYVRKYRHAAQPKAPRLPRSEPSAPKGSEQRHYPNTTENPYTQR
ncbi:MAG: polysaccharide deacetylase 2 family uncharacterized protein YibQ [Gammaproteobacteria bacterium]|jgi:polysaccharide deacetylase 2 family uncharacterized protein YibQ